MNVSQMEGRVIFIIKFDGISAALFIRRKRQSRRSVFVLDIVVINERGRQNLHIKRKQNGKAVIILEAMEAKILFEIVKTGISNICAVQKAES